MKRVVALGIIAAMAVLVLILYLAGSIPNTRPYIIRSGKTVAASVMRDPPSAQFRHLKTGVLTVGKLKGSPALCGEINGKNLNNAYVGFVRFVAGMDEGDAILDPQTTSTDSEQEAAARKCEGDSIARGVDPGIVSAEAQLLDCQEAKRLTQERLERVKFEEAWKAACSNAR